MLTEDTLLGGRVRLRQPRDGLRAGLDAVMLAAAVPARPGERVLEAGCGSGAAFLCLAARVPGLRVTAVERDPVLAALARANAEANGLADRVEVLAGDIGDPALAHALAASARFDHAFANPPYWPGGTPPPADRRRAAVQEGEARLADWARFLAAPLAWRGTLALVLPAARLDAGLRALGDSGCGGPLVVPLWPRDALPAKRVLLRAVRGGRGPSRLAPGIALHRPGGGWTKAAAAILDAGAAIPEPA
ncbi:methyltransferase domain-containing protein [Roseomonas sp. NAR14]|uniref:Methyltransferase domain-containing protein n=2 Tax=Roseomonas acroporae TaxID=2937791 RepID=A0A9X1YDC6_9PROT|nr:methyltransferase domain-containing protein [Roseomonas acroporae]MCK8786632.1 methyltransferase domain-containing protein [Roseomonas acroporae]